MAPNTYQGVNSDLSQRHPVPPLPPPPPVIRGVTGPASGWGIAPVGTPPPWSEQAGCPHHMRSSCSSSSWPVLGSTGRRSPRLLALFFFTGSFAPLGSLEQIEGLRLWVCSSRPPPHACVWLRPCRAAVISLGCFHSLQKQSSRPARLDA